MKSATSVCVFLCVFAFAFPPAFANEPVQWDESYRKFTTVEQILTGVYYTTAFVSILINDDFAEPKWIGPVGPDQAAFDAIGAQTRGGRTAASLTSDVIDGAVISSMFAESLYVWMARDSPETAWQLFQTSTQALGMSLFFQNTIKYIVARKRPEYPNCDESAGDDCARPSVSFYSGHSSTAFAATGVLCVNAMHLDIYTRRGQFSNFLPCLGALTMAITTASLRITAYQHYLTDVLTGTGIGIGIGFFYPWFARYLTFGNEDVSATVMAAGTQHGGTLGLTGSF